MSPPAQPKSPASDERFRLARIRHDLRTPINHIIGYSEILQEDAEGRVPAEFLGGLAGVVAPGTTLVVTQLASSGATTGVDMTVVTADPPASP